MSIWILQLELTAEEEKRIHERACLPLPLGDVPDLSMVLSQVELRHLLKALHSDEPPETITRHVGRIWSIYSVLHEEDVIAVPLRHGQKVALAEVTGRYRYEVGEGGTDVHLIPVRWFPGQPAIAAFGKYKDLFAATRETMREVAAPDARTAIRDKLPYKYNRFAKWKWLLAIFFLMGIVRALQHLTAP